MQKVVFLDRDGVINKNRKNYVKNVDELEIFPEIGNLIKLLKNNGFLIIVITNQSAINRGLTTHNKINEIHNKIQKYLEQFMTSIDYFYYCPHTPEEKCVCRKPNPGLILKAATEHSIDLQSSWFIGDQETDMLAAKNAGCNHFLVKNSTEMNNAVKQIINN